VTLLYADTSALARAYLPDEPEHGTLRELLLESDHAVVTSQLATLELAAAIAAAGRARRIDDVRATLARIDKDLTGRPVALLEFRGDLLFPTARRLIANHPLFAIDAVHLASALAQAPRYAADDEVVFVTADRRQADAARSEALAVWEG
jgi:hypothetical protein